MSDQYEGWTNYETWLVSLWSRNTGTPICCFEEMIEQHGDKVKGSIFGDFLNLATNAINWDELYDKEARGE